MSASTDRIETLEQQLVEALVRIETLEQQREEDFVRIETLEQQRERDRKRIDDLTDRVADLEGVIAAYRQTASRRLETTGAL